MGPWFQNPRCGEIYILVLPYKQYYLYTILLFFIYARSWIWIKSPITICTIIHTCPYTYTHYILFWRQLINCYKKSNYLRVQNGPLHLHKVAQDGLLYVSSNYFIVEIMTKHLESLAIGLSGLKNLRTPLLGFCLVFLSVYGES